MPKSPPPTPRPYTKETSDPFLKTEWLALRKRYFPDRPDIDSYTVVWSRRDQKRTLASCNTQKRRIRVARELDLDRYHCWLAPLLYHEMCHAVLDRKVSKSGKKFLWHGPEFRQLEKMHPETASLDNWIAEGGWAQAVRSHRSRVAHAKR
ncbi:MAG: SprT-like domain-containing protein, partial [Bdellovibrionales bacterium]|nr:SprT-like domain-containing protein [Bdellovibrionales bacterium]